MMIKPWFKTPQHLQNYVVDLILAELSALRPGWQMPSFQQSEVIKVLKEDEFNLDSLEKVSLSVSLTRSIHLEISSIEDNLLNQVSIDDWILISHKSLNIYSEKISFKTSGSVGLKKYNTHSIAQLEEEASVLGKLLNGRKRILKTVPSNHIYGFIFTILLPRYLGEQVEIIDVRNLSFNTILSLMESGDLIIAYPEFWRCMDESNITFPSDIIGVNSTGPCPNEVGENLLRKNLKSFLEVYGSSETAGIGWRNHPMSPYTLFPFWKKDLQTGDEIDRLLPDYFTKSYKLQDELVWTSSTQFFVKKRKDEIVQIGGVNVSIDHVREKLMEHHLVEDACVRLMRPDEGIRLKAFIVLKKSIPEYEKVSEPNYIKNKIFIDEIESYINKSFNTQERPKSITFGLKIPVNKLGKKADWFI